MAMETEGQGQKNKFASQKLNDMFGNFKNTETFYYCDGSPADKAQKRCNLSSSILKEINLVTRIKKCGHIALTDEYLKYYAVRSSTDIPRMHPSARHVVLMSTQ